MRKASLSLKNWRPREHTWFACYVCCVVGVRCVFDEALLHNFTLRERVVVAAKFRCKQRFDWGVCLRKVRCAYPIHAFDREFA
jgi:hypothetical protein